MSNRVAVPAFANVQLDDFLGPPAKSQKAMQLGVPSTVWISIVEDITDQVTRTQTPNNELDEDED